MRIVSGKFKHRRLKVPKGDHIRPTSERLRESLFNICQMEVVDAKFLDLFSGTGAVGLEALSRGAAHVTFVEQHPESIKVLEANLQLLGVKNNSHLIQSDAFKVLSSLQGSFDLIYIDPPYHLDPTPLLSDLSKKMHLFHQNSRIFLESSFSMSIKGFPENLILKKERKMGKTLLREFFLAF